MAHSKDQSAQTESLLNRTATGDEQAYGELIDRVSNRLLQLARVMLRKYPDLRRWEQTDDVFQNVALRLHRSLRQVRPESTREFYSLATLEIRRSLIDLCRHHFGPEGTAGKYQSDVQNTTGKEVRGVVGNHVDRWSDESLEVWSRFHNAIGQLPEDERTVMQLVWYGGMKQAEVASLLKVSVPTIKRRWYRARLRVRAAMGGQVPSAVEPDRHG